MAHPLGRISAVICSIMERVHTPSDVFVESSRRHVPHAASFVVSARLGLFQGVLSCRVIPGTRDQPV